MQHTGSIPQSVIAPITWSSPHYGSLLSKSRKVATKLAKPGSLIYQIFEGRKYSKCKFAKKEKRKKK
jgi:hypothetical protein